MLIADYPTRSTSSALAASLETLSTGELLFTVAFIAVVVIGLIAGAVGLVVQSRRKRLVVESSGALASLDVLNSRSRPNIQTFPAIRMSFPISVNSKAKFDRFDLIGYMSDSIIDRDDFFAAEVNLRVQQAQSFASYHHDFELLAYQLLGTSSHPDLERDRYIRLERRIFDGRKLRAPEAKAHIVSSVSYRSPKGQNAYSRQLVWNFEQLRTGLRVAQDTRARQSTAEAMRQRERRLMTSSLRVDILRRDNNRCRSCGAGPSDGVTLHIDHIVPVSHGGRTLATNLQTLCQQCNLGKSNRFVG